MTWQFDEIITGHMNYYSSNTVVMWRHLEKVPHKISKDQVSWKLPFKAGDLKTKHYN